MYTQSMDIPDGAAKKPTALSAGTDIPLNRVKSLIDTCKEIVAAQ